MADPGTVYAVRRMWGGMWQDVAAFTAAPGFDAQTIAEDIAREASLGGATVGVFQGAESQPYVSYKSGYNVP